MDPGEAVLEARTNFIRTHSACGRVPESEIADKLMYLRGDLMKFYANILFRKSVNSGPIPDLAEHIAMG